MASKLLASAVVTFALLACTQSFDGTKGPCNNGTCKADVVIVSGSCADPKNITVVDPNDHNLSLDPLPVPRGSSHSIEWTIQSEGFTWVAPLPPVPGPTGPVSAGGISGLPDPPFDSPHVTGNAKKYDIHDKNPETVPTPYKYGISLTDPSGMPCPVKDPTIRNGS